VTHTGRFLFCEAHDSEDGIKRFEQVNGAQNPRVSSDDSLQCGRSTLRTLPRGNIQPTNAAKAETTATLAPQIPGLNRR